MKRIRWSDTAIDDLQRIKTYLEPIDAEMARSTLLAIRASVRRLKPWPLSAPSLDGAPFRKLSVPQTPYLIVFRIENDFVIVLRVYHSAQDWRSPRNSWQP